MCRYVRIWSVLHVQSKLRKGGSGHMVGQYTCYSKVTYSCVRSQWGWRFVNLNLSDSYYVKHLLTLLRISIYSQCNKTSALVFCTSNGKEKKAQVCVNKLACMFIILLQLGSPVSVWNQHYCVEVYTKNRPKLFIPLSALVRNSQTLGSFAEPLIPFPHMPQIKLTYLILTGVCFGAPLLWTPLIETINSRCPVHLHR